MGVDQHDPDDDEAVPSSLKDSLRNVLEEARMLIPGAQAIFGFQLIAVFNQPFDRLTPFEQNLHLAATALTVVAIGLFMAPAAYHRQAEPESISRHFLRLASRHLAWGTVPLAISICLEIYIVGTLITGRRVVNIVIAALLFAFLTLLWYGLPRLSPSRQPARAKSSRGDR
jgi:hypothetical protein